MQTKLNDRVSFHFPSLEIVHCLFHILFHGQLRAQEWERNWCFLPAVGPDALPKNCCIILLEVWGEMLYNLRRGATGKSYIAQF